MPFCILNWGFLKILGEISAWSVGFCLPPGHIIHSAIGQRWPVCQVFTIYIWSLEGGQIYEKVSGENLSRGQRALSGSKKTVPEWSRQTSGDGCHPLVATRHLGRSLIVLPLMQGPRLQPIMKLTMQKSQEATRWQYKVRKVSCGRLRES